MTVWYNAPNDGEIFAVLICTDWVNVNSKIEFEELCIREDDDFIYFFMYATKLSDAINTSDRSWKFEPQKVLVKFAKKDYEKYSYKEKKRIPVVQSRFEKWLHKFLIDFQYDHKQIYSGKLEMQDSSIIGILLSGLDLSGNPAPKEILDMMTANYIQLTTVTSPMYLTDEIKLPDSRKGNSGYSKVQTELEKLNDRTQFIINAINTCCPEYEAKCVNDFCEEKLNLHPQGAAVREIIDWCIMIMKSN